METGRAAALQRLQRIIAAPSKDGGAGAKPSRETAAPLPIGMSAPAATPSLIRCDIRVLANGTLLKPATPSGKKDVAVEIAVREGGACEQLRILGLKRDVRLSHRDVVRINAGHVAEGRLVLEARDRLQVFLSNASAADMERIVRGFSAARVGEGLGPGKQRGPGAAGVSATGASARAPAPGSAGKAARTGEADKAAEGGRSRAVCGIVALLDQSQLMEVVIEFFAELPTCAEMRRLSEAARSFELEVGRRIGGIRIASSRGASVLPAALTAAVMRHKRLELGNCLQHLDLSGCRLLSASDLKAFAEALGQESAGIRHLGLRDCKGLAGCDASVQRLLAQCPRLESVDLLGIPRLSNRALQAKLGSLRVLLAGHIESAGATERTRQQEQRQQLQQRSISAITVDGPVKFAKSAPKVAASHFTSALIARFAQTAPPAPPPGSESSRGSVPPRDLGGAPLTDLLLGHCGDIEVIPRLPKTLVSLDLRWAGLQMADGALPAWKPLACCLQLRVLSLAGCDLLSSSALVACIRSLPEAARLQVLDLSSTAADAALLAALPRCQPALAGLRVANCSSFNDADVAGLVRRLASLEELDVYACLGLESPDACCAAIAEEWDPGARPGPQGGGGGLAAVRTLGGPAASGARPAEVRAAPSLPQLQLLGVGGGDRGWTAEAARWAFVALAPNVRVVGSTLQVMDYSKLPPRRTCAV